MNDKAALLYLALIAGIMGGCIYRYSPTFDYSSEVLFDTRTMKASGKQWGIVTYGTEGYAWEVNWRRSDAQQKIAEICAPMKYEIVDANAVAESKGLSLGGYSFDLSEPSVVMRFECVATQ